MTAGHNQFFGGAGDDAVSAFISKLGPDDLLELGAGVDTLRILSSSFTLDFSNGDQIAGLDVIDVTAATVPASPSTPTSWALRMRAW